MKRKRGYKKGKGKKAKAADLKDGKAEAEIVTVAVEEDSSAGLEAGKDGDSNSGMDLDVDTPDSAATDQLEKLSPEVVHQKPVERKVQVVYGRVRVKLKSAKHVDSGTSAIGTGTVVETDKRGLEHDKSSQEQVMSSQEKSSLEKESNSPQKEKSAHEKEKDTNGLQRKKELAAVEVDGSNDSSPDIMLSALGNLPKKSGGIKIKAPVLSSNNVASKRPSLVEEGTPPPKMQKVEKDDSKYDKHELDTALVVITKVMKMDAAEPFNAPVDPITLGIPDYFDVIDTPMDFGTICNNIQSGSKYKNSEDVFKDVQYIWDNCYKYNNKGDYIVDLMRRVKKNFTKYWQAAGLYCDQPHTIGGADHAKIRVGATSSQGKNHMNTSSSKGKIKKRPGFRRHKDGCLCAVCVLKRRRIEKEGKDLPLNLEDWSKTNDKNMDIDSKQEGASPAGSPFGGETSSNLDSQNPDSDAEMDGRATESERENADQQPSSFIDGKDEEHAVRTIPGSFQTLKDSQRGDDNEESARANSVTQEALEPASLIFVDAQEDTKKQFEEDPVVIQQRKLQEAEAKKRRIKALNESLNNPVLLRLCGTLFPDDSNSIWYGAHSVIRKQKRAGSFSSLHTAIESLLK